jgi:hypothetical protein
MITALISLAGGLFSAAAPEFIKEIRDSRAHKREIEFLALNQKLALERAAHEASIKIEEMRTNAITAEIQANEKSFDALMQQAMTPVGIGWIDGLNSAVRPLTAIAFMGLFAVALLAYIFGFGASDPAFGSAMGALFTEMMQAVVAFMFGARAISSRIAKTA